MKLVLALFALLGFVAVHPPGTNASNILAIFPLVSKSHFKVGEALVLGLAEAGQEVTLITAYDFKPKLANVKVLQLTGAIEIAEGQSLYGNEANESNNFFLPANRTC